MITIDKSTWPRRRHFELFNRMDYPHFNICANLDITRFYPLIKSNHISFSMAVTYLVSRTANDFEAFRMRIRGEQIIIHEIVNPSSTMLMDDDLFSFCTVQYDSDFKVFSARHAATVEEIKNKPTLEDLPGADDLLFLTSIPWISFTCQTHTIKMNPADSIPRISWGKYFNENDRIKLPFSVQVHHALMDGVHVGRYYMKIQEYLDEPAIALGLSN
ncbi:MAG: chloramphenicol acetyltransferase [Anaerolineae bacterium]|nr:chloramphenicol acetyltransferase [Anaerolineae bacterium]